MSGIKSGKEGEGEAEGTAEESVLWAKAQPH